MYEPNMHEADTELEQALYSAFVRVSAPDDLILRVEQRLLAARRQTAVPTFRLLSLQTRSVWTSLWSIAAHASVFALIALLFLHTRNQGIVKTSDIRPDRCLPSYHFSSDEFDGRRWRWRSARHS